MSSSSPPSSESSPSSPESLSSGAPGSGPAPDDPTASSHPGATDEAAPDDASISERVRAAWNRSTAFETVLVAGGVVLFLVLLYEMQRPAQEGAFLTPPLVGLAGAVLLWPLRQQKAARALLLSGGVLLLLWTMDKISGILVPFAGVYILAYLLNPVVTGLWRRYRIPRWLSSLFISGLVVGTVVLFVLLLAPSVASQVDTLSARLLGSIEEFRGWLSSSSFFNTLEAIGLLEKQEVLQQLQSLVQQQARRLPGAVQNLVSSLGSVLGVVTLLALVPVLLFYTLKDYPDIQATLIDLFPTAGGRRDYLIEAGSIVGQYLRGQLIISLIATANVSLLLFLFDVPFWLIIGLLAGILNFIPQLGAIIALAVGAVIALVFGGWVKVLVVLAVLMGESLLEQSVLTPNILGYQVGLHPLLVLFSLLAFGTFFGVLGLLVAVPLTAILATAYRAYRDELTLELNDYAPAASTASDSSPSA